MRHPQTNGKIKRFFRTLEIEIGRFRSLPDFIGYNNEKRLHFSLDIDGGETPLLAFRSKKAGRRIRADSPKWMKLDAPG